MRFVSGFTATAFGPAPTATVAITLFVEPSITETELLLKFVT
jgi:hypothetical protein